LGLFFLLGIVAKAQNSKEEITSGKIIFDISYPDLQLDNPSMAALPDKAVMLFNENKSKVIMSMIIGKMEIISDYKGGASIVLMDFPNNKWYTEMEKGDIEKEKKSNPKPVVDKTRETKMIAGYSCIKTLVEVTSENTKVPVEIWTTNEINAKNSISSQIEGVDGFMMEFFLSQSGLNMKMTFRSIEKMNVADSEFNIPDGFVKKSSDELKRMGVKN
jgi:hypothetical protein